MQWKISSVSETVQDDLKDDSPVSMQAFLDGIFSRSCAPVDKLSTDMVFRAVPLQQPSFLYRYATATLERH